MQVKVVSSSKDDKSISIHLPNGLVFNRFVAKGVVSAASKSGDMPISADAMRALFHELARSRRVLRDRDLPLVEVWSSDGDYVLIKL